MEQQHVSSHWREMLRTYQNTGGEFDGLRGFGGLASQRTAVLHRLMQRRFRTMGKAYPGFPRYLAAGTQVAKRQGRALCLDMLRQVLTLTVCDALGAIKPDATYTVIGDGFATLSSIILDAIPGSRVALINLPQVLEVDRAFIGDHGGRATFIAAGDGMPVSLTAFNVASMQEMNPDVIAYYFALIQQRSQFFYCCNRVEKRLPDGTITRFADYPWYGETLLDEPCPWHQEFYTFRPPFWRRYDGPIQHRLISN